MTVKVGLFLRLEAKADKADEVEAILNAALAAVQREESTAVWLALRLGPTTFAVVDAFADDAGRQDHLEANGQSVEELARLLAASPEIVYTDVIAAKLPS
ncbi:antibiotic biosynthesis monooxygenase [Nocardia sp. NEAU-G5]|uniref:Antibiotic biosynthesis monooxygenase n=1 Tax=Nocardia albiluteola TaxID=2842303 RepID=A0ABS6AZU7_9NOCA|nr:antibiotic biosynthesis monooxygenase [Nocardia albiluteola]MBU3063577.1 antibiotic biosynthesis monooxygenase [Nocardia albiluteola]